MGLIARTVVARTGRRMREVLVPYVPAAVAVGRDAGVAENELTVGRRRAFLLLGAIAIFALVLRLLFLQIFFSPDDDPQYLRDAYLLAHGDFVHNTHWALRLGVVAPTAGFIRLFGFHDWSVILYPLSLGVLGVPLIYALGSAFFNRAVGLIAALALACFPEHIYFSTLVMDDLPGAFWGALALLLAYQSRAARSARHYILLCAASGLALAMSYLCWEVNLFLIPLCCLACAWSRERRDLTIRIATVLLVILAVLAAECVLYWRIAGAPLLRWTLANGAEATAESKRDYTVSLQYFLLRIPKLYFTPTNRQYFLYSWLTVWAGFMLRKHLKEPAILFILIWFLITLGIVGFGVFSLHPLRVLFDLHYLRYLDNLTFPAILLIARALYQTGPKCRDREWAV